MESGEPGHAGVVSGFHDALAEEIVRERRAVPSPAPSDSIAIVGIGCRYADSRGPEEFWEILRTGRNTVRDVPPHRIDLGYDIDHFYDPRPRIPGKISSRKAGFLDHPELFDPAAFGIAPRDALTMEPQQRLMIEVTWDALEDAGIVPESIEGERVAVILGYMAEDYSRERMGVLGEEAVYRGHDVFTVGGMSHAVLSGRIAYLLGVTGPSFTLDTACSSSLIATHLACESLKRGESKMAIAGGANLFLSPEGNIALSRSGMLSKSGACKAFDASADGFVRAEGAGIVVLRPLADALEEGNPIYAVIRGSGISSDGRDGGHMMAPGRKGQAQAMRDAYAGAGILPSEIHYVETHGTGTMIGDPVEISALADVMGPGRPADRPLLVASVKGNLGHTESASGVAGLIKAALAIRHRQLPAQLHFETPTPAVAWGEIPIRVQAEMTPWPYPGPAKVGVNSFGISGTNAHVVLSSPPESISKVALSPRKKGPVLLPITGHDSKSLHAMIERTRDSLIGKTDRELDDLAYTLGQRRTHRAHRLTVVADSAEEMRGELHAYLEGNPFSSVRSAIASLDPSKKLVMVFPGQGGQWLGMGRQLLTEESVFSDSIDRLGAAYDVHVDWSLREMLEAEGGIDWTRRLDVLQPLLVAIEIALAELWGSWGIRPDRVIGQSLGEIAAAYVAGCLRLDDMARLACHRGRIVARASGQGGMAVVAAPRDIVRDAIARVLGRVEVAGSNSPTTTIVSGEVDGVQALVAEFDAQGVFARQLEVDFASHCFHMDPLLAPFREGIEGIDAQPARIPMDSTVDGCEKRGDDLGTEYWLRNLRSPVAFDRGLASSIEAGGRDFIEVSPHPVLARPIDEIAVGLGHSVCFVSSLRANQDEQRSMRTSLGELFVHGADIDFSAFQSTGRVVSTPLYAYQRKRFWFGERNRSHRFRAVHPLLGARSQSSVDPRIHSWDFLLDLDSAGFLHDYRVDGDAGAPASLYPEIALAVGEAMWPGESISIEDFEFMSPLIFGRTKRRLVQAILRTGGVGAAELRIASRESDESVWQFHALCMLRPVDPMRSVDAESSLVRTPASALSSEGYHAALERCGVSLGPRCRTLHELERETPKETEEASLLARMMLPRISESEWHAYHAHPAMLENCFQMLGALFEPAVGVRPIAIGRIHLIGSLGSDCWCRATRRRAGSHHQGRPDEIEADLEFFDREGAPLGRIDALRAEVLPASTSQRTPPETDLHRIDWVLAETSHSEYGEETQNKEVSRWVVVSDSTEEAGIFAAELQKQGGTCVFCEKVEDLPAIARRMRADPTRPWGFVLLAWGHDPTGVASEPLSHRDFRVASWAGAIRDQCGEAVQVWIATRGLERLRPGENGPGDAARRIAQEVESFASCVDMQRCRLFDASAALAYSERVALATRIGVKSEERQWIARGEELFVPRLVQSGSLESARKTHSFVAGDRNFRAVHARREGLDCVVLEESPEPELEPGCILVEVQSAALSQLDVLKGLGLARGAMAETHEVGADFAGIVIAVVDSDSAYQIGDEVIGVHSGSLARRLTVPAAFVAPKPAFLDFGEAASLPFPYLIAQYALEVVARLRAGERVWVLSAAGGVGQAMIDVARSVGAEVSATASTPARRAALRGQGAVVVEEGPGRVTTESTGYDVIVASGSGARLHSALERLAPGGRYLDLCPRNDFALPEMGALRLAANRSVSAIDVGAMMRSEPSLVSALLERTAREAGAGRVDPLEATVFPLSQVARAMRYMAQNRHLGRVCIDWAEAAQTRIRAKSVSPRVLRDSGPFVVSGSEPEIQAAIVQWLRRHGAEDVTEWTQASLDAFADPLSGSRTKRWAGWIHVVSEAFRGSEEIDRLAPALDADDIDFRALVSVRSPLCGDSAVDRAWETRAWIDRLLLSDLRPRARAATFSVGGMTEGHAANHVADLVGRVLVSQEANASYVDLPEDDLRSLFSGRASPLLSLLPSPNVVRQESTLTRSEWNSLTPPERRIAMQQFVRGALAAVLGLSEEQREAIDMESHLDEVGLDSLMTLELFLGLGRDLELEIAADWFAASPSLDEIVIVLMERLDEGESGETAR